MKLKNFLIWSGMLLMVASFVLIVIVPQFGNLIMTTAVTGIVLLLIAAVKSGRNIMTFFSSPSTKDGTNRIVFTLIIIAMLIVINIILIENNHEFDMTSNKVHSLSPQSIKIAKNLTDQVKITAFFSDNMKPLKMGFEYLLEKYQLHTKHINADFIDPLKNPMMAESYEVTEDGTVILSMGEKRVRLEKINEEGFTHALIRLTAKTENTLYFLTGQGERNFDSAGKGNIFLAKARLTDMNLKVEPLNLIDSGEIPDYCKVLIICGASSNFLPGELSLIGDYLNKGGKILITVDSNAPTELIDFIANYSITVGNDRIIETGTMTRLMGGDVFTPLVNSFPTHPVNQDFDSACFFPTARSVLPPENDEEIKSIAMTSTTSWAETDSSIFQFDENEDMEGPVSIAVAMTRPVKNSENKWSKLVVIGDSDFISDDYFSTAGNGNFFLNIVNWMVEREELIAIHSNSRASGLVVLTTAQGNLLLWCCAIFIPLLPLILGFFIWFRRRNL